MSKGLFAAEFQIGQGMRLEKCPIKTGRSSMRAGRFDTLTCAKGSYQSYR